MDRHLVALISALLLVVSTVPAPAVAWGEPYPRVKAGGPTVGAGSALMLTGSQAVLPSGGRWRQAPEYLELFTAIAAHPGAYETLVSPLDLDAALRQLAAETGLLHPPGAMSPQSLLASDAFGRDGLSNRWTLARLYGARRARVARAPRAEGGRVVESWTLISPYPDATLDHLDSGTLLIVLRVP